MKKRTSDSVDNNGPDRNETIEKRIGIGSAAMIARQGHDLFEVLLLYIAAANALDECFK